MCSFPICRVVQFCQLRGTDWVLGCLVGCVWFSLLGVGELTQGAGLPCRLVEGAGLVPRGTRRGFTAHSSCLSAPRGELWLVENQEEAQLRLSSLDKMLSFSLGRRKQAGAASWTTVYKNCAFLSKGELKHIHNYNMLLFLF